MYKLITVTDDRGRFRAQLFPLVHANNVEKVADEESAGTESAAEEPFTSSILDVNDKSIKKRRIGMIWFIQKYLIVTFNKTSKNALIEIYFSRTEIES